MTTEMSPEDLQAELARLRAENARFKAAQASGIRLKASEKGGVSVYGLNARFPITLYPDQWQRLLAAAPQIEAFIEENRAQLKWKATSGEE